VLITGGSSGIGKASAIKVAEAGAKVIIVARGEKELHETRDEIIAAGGKCWAYTCDLTDMTSCDELVKTSCTTTSTSDVLVNNAGPLDPSFGSKPATGPLPRLRADHAAELFWLPAA
jgi:NADP-dependent 3-hydroxy acid dehydrogenase YdfG